MGSRNQLKDRVRPFFLGPPNKARNSSSATSRPITIPKVTLNHPKFSLKMKWIILSLALFASACAEDFEQEDGEARLGYITVGSGGATTLTFNATSIQNAVILGLFILVLGALVLPLFGVSMDEYISDSGSVQDTDTDTSNLLMTDTNSPNTDNTPRDRSKNSVPSSMLYTKPRNTTNKFLQNSTFSTTISAIYTHLLSYFLTSVSHHS